jgi:hypothetical protein
MSQPSDSPAALFEYADLDPWNGMFYAMAERLTPLMAGEGRGKTYGRYAAGEAIFGYHPETRADYATIGRILALSLSTVTAAALAGTPGLAPAEQIRFLGKVQSLSQAADRAERLMMTRRQRARDENIRGDTLVPRPAGRPSHYAPLPAEDPASGIARNRAAEARAKAEAQTIADAAPQVAATEDPNPRTELQAVEPMAVKPQPQPDPQRAPSAPPAAALTISPGPIPAIRTNGKAGAMSLREALLNGSAMPPFVGHSGGAPT